MRDFAYARAAGPEEAVRLAGPPHARFVAGGTDLLNLMKDGVQEHDLLVDLNALDLAEVDASQGRVRIGATARMSDVAADPAVTAVPVLVEALLAGASPQIRNMASIGGNLLQRTRCWYFRDATMPCNKRVPGSGCPALDGVNRWHAVLGGSEHCIAVHPSDLAVALTALGATVNTLHGDGERRIPVAEFYLQPGSTPDRETALRPGELITSVDVPVPGPGTRSRYLKLRDRATFEFAVVSVAAVVRLAGGVVQEARLAFGGIGTRPWRSPEAEQALVGRPLTAATTQAAGRALVRDAVPRRHNAFKVDLVQRALADVLGGMR
ncbi:xanthine dehydrogenase YagS FAD-binding subunit [Pseudonocardia hierapolitana]|uniref:Xanthine dehydrogenase YagS FAD-binding subunit n=1 Tax=Pseudonocardia hierapolitana TaxID=1128676 RepID=A0A561SJV2_9PSEU|nr:xanthine dehydrogenase family protein subunit M [Pseudonocardia hierapolitana]TWF75114.1 xanthine dehydrogenase YagS FAD-binding subunit [Pseudonocardia hierapolitana]